MVQGYRTSGIQESGDWLAVHFDGRFGVLPQQSPRLVSLCSPLPMLRVARVHSSASTISSGVQVLLIPTIFCSSGDRALRKWSITIPSATSVVVCQYGWSHLPLIQSREFILG